MYFLCMNSLAFIIGLHKSASKHKSSEIAMSLFRSQYVKQQMILRSSQIICSQSHQRYLIQSRKLISNLSQFYIQSIPFILPLPVKKFIHRPIILNQILSLQQHSKQIHYNNSMIIKVIYRKETHVMVLEEADYSRLLAKINSSFLNLPSAINLTYLDSEGDRISVADTSDLSVIFTIPQQKSIKLEIEDLEEEDQGLSFRRRVNECESEVLSYVPELELESISELNQENGQDILPADLKCEPKEEVAKKVEDEIADLIRSKIEELIPQVKHKIQQAKAPKVAHVHHGVRCDGCAVKPIIGNRYKCSICHDFDYCDKCEDTIDHPHAFLKIKSPSQAPRILITSLVDDFIPGLDINGVTFDQSNLDLIFKKVEPETVPVELEKEEVLETVAEVEVPKREEIKVEDEVENAEGRLINGASLLESIYEVDFFEAYQFIKNNAEKSLEELCQKFYDQVVAKQ